MNNEKQTQIELTFKLPIEAVNVILTALNEVAMPKKYTQPVADFLAQEANKQIQEQQQPEVTDVVEAD